MPQDIKPQDMHTHTHTLYNLSVDSDPTVVKLQPHNQLHLTPIFQRGKKSITHTHILAKAQNGTPRKCLESRSIVKDQNSPGPTSLYPNHRKAYTAGVL